MGEKLRTLKPKSWRPASWKQYQARQQPRYEDEEALHQVCTQIAKLPPLVTSWEIEGLKEQLAEASEGRRFLLQGGDCSENFEECNSAIIAAKLKIILQMSLVLIYGSGKRVIRVGRIAGQYAKPRSSDFEEQEGLKLPSYRGDLVNRLSFDAEKRKPDPTRLLQGYTLAALTLNFIRSLIDGGFADLHHPENWDLDFASQSPMFREYQRIVDALNSSLKFFESLSGMRVDELERVDFYTSHEGLHLHYEQAQTRFLEHRQKWYDLSTHFPWIGNRTRSLDGAHVEFFRGIANPVAVKVGNSMTPDELGDLIQVLNPDNEPGRLTLIHRFGAERVEESLPPLIEAVKSSRARVLWCCDPMHGNTEKTPQGKKTRDFNKILSELQKSFQVHRELDSVLGGVHFELTGDNVTECIGGARGLTEADLDRAYKSQVDPRLNFEQALEMAMLIASMMEKNGG